MPDTSIIPYLVWFWESNRIKLDGYEQPIIQWHHTDLPNTFKLLLSHSNLAHSVCYNVIDNNVQQTDCIPERIFHELAKEGFTDYFSQYALCDAPAQLRVGAGRAAANNVIGDWELLTIQ